MLFVETPIFTREISNLLGGQEYHSLQLGLLFRPEQACSGGVQMRRKDFDNLVGSIKQAGKIRRGEMKASRTFQFSPADVKGIRLQLKKSQAQFALMIGVSVATLQNWEQGRRSPEGPARALLKIAAEKPEAVIEALSKGGD